MAKKTKSKSKSAAAAAGAKLPMTHQTVALRSNNDNAGYFPHDAFEAALRRYAHPAAVADLNLLTRGGPEWKRYLEAFGNSVNDLSIMIHQQVFTGRLNYLLTLGMTMMMCPLSSAFAAWKGPQSLIIIQHPSVYVNLVHSRLPMWGRPLSKKADHLRDHDMKVVEMYRMIDNSREERDGYSITMRTTSSSNRKEVNLNKNKIDWMNLTQICIKELVLYGSNEGKYIEGKLLVEPFTPQVGTTTVFEDSNGDVIHVALYNFLPDGLYGKEAIPLASQKLPMGATVRIAEPFFKIFQDGCRGIRIDNPNDISVFSSGKECDTPTDEEQLLLIAKTSGNALVKKKLYNAASEAYIAGIRQADMVPTLLSNRSQAYAMMNEWDQSFADSAASLTMRPDNSKTWFRYNKALANLPDLAMSDIRRDMMKLMLRLEIDQPAAGATGGQDASALKDAGNAAFKNKQYAEAVQIYTLALVAHGETSRALLSNWALCCIRNGANLDALSASFASLRVCYEAKAVTRLAKSLLSIGEPGLCLSALTNELLVDVIKGSDAANEGYELLEGVNFTFETIEEGYSLLPDSRRLKPVISRTVVSEKHLPAWIGPIESFRAGVIKGRGVRATEGIGAGEIVLIEPPLAISETESKDDCLFSIDSTFKDRSQIYLREAIVLRSQRECVLSRIVDCLSDGVNQRGVTSLQDLLPNLDAFKLLLPTHYEYTNDEAKLELTFDRIDAIVHVNAFGGGDMKDTLAGSIMGRSSARLVPATSLFNHSTNHPTCACIISKGGCSITFAVKDIKAGDELTICYHHDKEAIQRHWGIHE